MATATQIEQRQDEGLFFAKLPKRINEFEILSATRFKPGDDANYACAYVVAHRDERGGVYSTHLVVRVDDEGEYHDRVAYRLIEGHYDFRTLADAEADRDTRI